MNREEAKIKARLEERRAICGWETSNLSFGRRKTWTEFGMYLRGESVIPLGKTKRNYLRSMKRCMEWAKKQGYVDRKSVEEVF